MNEVTLNNDNLICTPGNNSELGKIRQFITEHAIDFGFDDVTSQKIALAVDEACSNLIRHAYKYDPHKKLCVSVEANGQEFIIKVLDEGQPFNPLNLNSPDMKEYFSEFKRGGLGIHIIKLIMDEISYHPSINNSGTNILCLKKYLH